MAISKVWVGEMNGPYQTLYDEAEIIVRMRNLRIKTLKEFTHILFSGD